ncbi:MAG: hypothetical protein JW891_01190, partial [Candidatus Lokiarchaeota archaeon]|nr:hypothetical protein [Candidatus Lokiarchaeota archaeon]
MSASNYKVVFSGMKESDSELMTLTFRAIPLDHQIEIAPSFLQKIKEKSEEGNNIIHFRNIKDVIKLGKDENYNTYDGFFVVLYTLKKEEKKEGFLIAKSKKKGTLLVGYWPFNLEILEWVRESFNEFLNRFID